MKLSEIEEVARVVKDGPDYGLIESKVIQGISMLPVGTRFYISDQMQEYAKECVREAYKEITQSSYVSDGRVEQAGLNEIINKVLEEDMKND